MRASVHALLLLSSGLALVVPPILALGDGTTKVTINDFDATDPRPQWAREIPERLKRKIDQEEQGHHNGVVVERVTFDQLAMWGSGAESRLIPSAKFAVMGRIQSDKGKRLKISVELYERDTHGKMRLMESPIEVDRDDDLSILDWTDRLGKALYRRITGKRTPMSVVMYCFLPGRQSADYAWRVPSEVAQRMTVEGIPGYLVQTFGDADLKALCAQPRLPVMDQRMLKYDYAVVGTVTRVHGKLIEVPFEVRSTLEPDQAVVPLGQPIRWKLTDFPGFTREVCVHLREHLPRQLDKKY